MLLLIAIVIIIIIIVVYYSRPSKENFDSYYAQNVRLWPQNVYSLPFNPEYGEGWPANMYSRSYYWSPSFYTGSGLTYYYRPTSYFDPYKITRNRWIRNNGKYFNVSNRLDYINDAANYREVEPFDKWKDRYEVSC